MYYEIEFTELLEDALIFILSNERTVTAKLSRNGTLYALCYDEKKKIGRVYQLDRDNPAYIPFRFEGMYFELERQFSRFIDHFSVNADVDAEFNKIIFERRADGGSRL